MNTNLNFVPKRMTPVMEALNTVKDLTMHEFLALMQILNEKTKSSQDFSGEKEREYYCEGMFEDFIEDTKYFLELRKNEIDEETNANPRDLYCDAEHDERKDREFA